MIHEWTPGTTARRRSSSLGMDMIFVAFIYLFHGVAMQVGHERPGLIIFKVYYSLEV